MKFHHEEPRAAGSERVPQKRGEKVNNLREREREKVDISNLQIFRKNFEQNLVCWF
jgi:hypothetical protein